MRETCFVSFFFFIGTFVLVLLLFFQTQSPWPSSILITTTTTLTTSDVTSSSSSLFPSFSFSTNATTPLGLQLNKVAIIGAGAAGTSFANYLSKAFPHLEQLDVFEKESRIGGRVHSTVFQNSKYHIEEIVEWGASIFVDWNKNILNTFTQFNLTAKEDPDESLMALFNGTHVVYTLPIDDSWWTKFKWLCWYRTNLLKMKAWANEAATRLNPLYENDHLVFESYSELVTQLNLLNYTLMSSQAYFQEAFSDHYLRQVVEPITSVNYGHSLSEVHALASLVGLVSGTWYSVKEGNQRLFESLLSNSSANVFKETQVLDIQRSTEDPSLYTLKTNRGDFSGYQVVVVAIPLDTSSLPPFQTPPQPYHFIHVYHILGKLNTTTFPNSPGLIVPYLPTSSNLTSIARLRRFPEHDLDLFKVFAKGDIPLNDYFELWEQLEKKTTWAYPILTPHPVYPPLCLDGFHVYYLNGMERMLSTMETETLASLNLVRLLKKKFT